MNLPKLGPQVSFNKTLAEVYNLSTWQGNWNGYDALAPQLDAILHAISWFNAFYQFVTILNWRSPNVTAGPQGEVVFEWWNDAKKLTIYVSDKSVEYIQVWGPDIYGYAGW